MLDTLRIGTGFDVHAFSNERPLFIGGIKIPHPRGLMGHSDADVLIHAIVDAILGALAKGDIGQHFSPSDPRWKNAPSRDFLSYVAKLCLQEKARILSIDSTILCEAPKIMPHALSIRQNICDILELPFDRFHLKATTTEKLGFLGREEGIAAQAVCLLSIDRVTTLL